MPQNPVILVPCSPHWPAQFHAIAITLRAILGPLALRIDHIGSTAIPTLCAKDIIDIQLTVAALHNPALLDALAATGYQLRPAVTHDHLPPGHTSPPSDWEKLFFREPSGTRTTHLHVRAAGKPNQRYALLVRDYLRVHPAAATAYGRFKQRLAPHLERPDYVDVKDPVFDLIYQAAEAWAEKGWTPDPSDA